MKISLCEAGLQDCAEIHYMQKTAFSALLEKYQDFDTSPATETIEVIRRKIRQPCSKYYFIQADSTKIGAMRIITLDESTKRISPIFILPQYQNMGFAQCAVHIAEDMFSATKVWRLDTIKQERKLCYLYEKLGYKPTGREELIKDGMTILYYKKQIKL